MTFLVPACKRSIAVKKITEGFVSHCVFKIALKDGNSYALDLTRFQYGHGMEGVITLWSDYEKDMVATIVERRSVGSQAAKQQKVEGDLHRMARDGTSPAPPPAPN